MTIAPFSTDEELLSFARKFFRDRIGPFRADIAICLTPDANGHRAEFPALITCIGFVEFLSGLYAGNLESNGLANLQSYAARFMDTTKYDPLRLQVLYLVFRHGFRGGVCSFVGKLPYGLCQNGVLGPRQVGKVATTIGFDRAPHAWIIFVRPLGPYATAVEQNPYITISLPFEL
jgi:hypothetical protein